MLAQLQNLVKRDAETYKEEYIMQRSHFSSEINILGDLFITYLILFYSFNYA